MLPVLRQVEINPTLWRLVDKFWMFAHAIDVEHPHPDLFALFDGNLAKESDFSNLICDIVKLVTPNPNHTWHPYIIEALARLVIEHPRAREILQFMEDPAKNLLNVRFVAERKRRDQIRQCKTPQRFTLNSFMQTAESHWMNVPSDFRSLYRGTSRFLLDIEKAQVRHEYFLSLGLTAMAKEIQSSINDMKRESTTSQYYGFNRTTIQMTAAILAKMCGYNYVASPHEKGVFAFPDSFPGYNFCNSKWVACRPVAYPLHSITSSEDVVRLVDHLEAFPEAHGRPLFDHYWVVIPSVSYPDRSPYRFCDPDGECYEFNTMEEAQVGFEKTLLRYHYIVGVLLGERHGEHYFVSYWL